MIVDLLLTAGVVVDGSGNEPVIADVAISDGLIVAVGDLGNLEAVETVHVGGKYVMPGFVDAHSHADVTITDPVVHHALLRQGVTTVVTGQDGISHAGSGVEGGRWGGTYFAGINGPATPIPTLSEYREALAGKLRVNSAHLLSHGSMRYQRAGLSEKLDRGELRGIRQDVEDGLADGAVGLSTGLHYMPGLQADTRELIALAQPLAAAERTYVTHMRGYDEQSDAGIREVFQIARESGARVHVSHLHGAASALTRQIDEAADTGIDLTFDTYPYLRGFSLLSVPLLPWELLRLTPEALSERFQASDALAEMPGEWAANVRDAEDRIVLASVPGRAGLEGLSLRAASRTTGKTAPALVLDLIASTRSTVTAVFEQPETTTESDVRGLLRHPAHMGGSDGIFIGGRPHPRAWGTFARYLSRHVRDLGDWTWADAAVHLAASPGARFGLGGRGRLHAAAPADLFVVDPDRVADHATYADPRQVSSGIDDVWISGVRVLQSGELTEALPGRPLTWQG